ncbi:MAG: aminoglycoside phosphotransferase family protein [Flavobacteriaceae bacterium]|nr:aminoglycoside phosphotransferase family protein [Candidatus Onthonaster equi]
MALMDRVLAYYFEKPEDLIVKPITEGLINQTFEIKLGINRYILQQLNTSIFKKPEDIISNMLAIGNHLKMNEYPKSIINILPNLNQNYLTFVNDEVWRLTNYIPNSVCYNQVCSKEQAYQAAKAIGEFHYYLKDLDITRIKPSIIGFLDYKKRVESYTKAITEGNQQRVKIASEAINYINNHLPLVEKYLALEFPQRIVHADAKIGNFLFDQSDSTKVKAVIDWDTIIPGNILCDFGDMVRTYSNLRVEDDPNPEDNFSLSYYEAVKEGFLSELKNILTDKELEAIDLTAYVVILIQAIRFITDFLQDDIYYHTTRENQNLDRTINQINLLKSIQKHICIN